MNGPTNPPELEMALKGLWGASQLPFGAVVEKPYASASFEQIHHRLEQLVAVRACGLLHGPNGVGKSLLVQHFLRSLPDKRYKTLVLSHSSVTGTDLLRLLCAELGQTARMRRSDNVLLIRQGWQQLDRLWPVVVIDEAQNLSATALEEVRLLSCERRDTQPPFSLLLVGDEQLLPRLQMGINAPLLARLSFCLRLEPWTSEQLSGYVQARLEQVGIHANPFEAPALALLLQAGNGLPRLLNHLAQRALEEAAAQSSRMVTAAHVQRALELLPWVAQLAK
ncbi:MAG TPA: ATP-binding protein [Verrucomicrobiota bacterium]|nr:ATP-binding protein [Verrucomicrobiota bacterium]HQL78016.1 ATP-binding protein [Verrucomicrobiota bacterium]